MHRPWCHHGDGAKQTPVNCVFGLPYISICLDGSILPHQFSRELPETRSSQPRIRIRPPEEEDAVLPMVVPITNT